MKRKYTKQNQQQDMLDNCKADKEIADGMRYIDTNEPKDKRPFTEFIKEHEAK